MIGDDDDDSMMVMMMMKMMMNMMLMKMMVMMMMMLMMIMIFQSHRFADLMQSNATDRCTTIKKLRNCLRKRVFDNCWRNGPSAIEEFHSFIIVKLWKSNTSN